VEQQIRFCAASDGVTLAYAVHGRGTPIVRAATWLTHLHFDWQSPVWHHWLEGLGEAHTLIRYDERGSGLSDREVGELSVDTWVADLEAVVDAAGLDRFALLDVSQSGDRDRLRGPPSRARHAPRLYGGYARGRKFRRALRAARKTRWCPRSAPAGRLRPPTLRHLFSMLFLPYGTDEQMALYDELQRRSTSAATAARLYDARGSINVVDLVPQVTTKTLVMHARGDRVVPVEEGRLLGARIPDARLVLVE